MIDDPKKIIEAYEAGSLKKILLIRISRLGDLIFITPAIRALKARFPKAKLHFLTNPYSKGVLDNNPYLDDIHVMDRKRLAWRYLRMDPIIGRLKEQGFDLAIPFRMRKEYNSLFRKIKVPGVYQLQAPAGGFDESMHQADRFIKGLSPLGVEPDALGMDLFFSSEEEDSVRGFIDKQYQPETPWAVLHAGCHQSAKTGPGSSAMKRIWPLEQWVGLVQAIKHELGVPPILMGFSPGDLAYNDEITARSGIDCPVYRPGTVGETAALLHLAGGFVCLDTGPLHVASAMNTPTVALFGPSRPALTGPYRNRGGATVIQKKIHCSPCKGKGIKCADNICMKQITSEEVVQALLERIRTPSALIRPNAKAACEAPRTS